MSIYGRPEVAYYQLTPMGMSRVRAGQVGHLDPASRNTLLEIARLGGTAEWDELKFYGSKDSPRVLGVALRRLVDLGYITPVTAGVR